ncbi:MAG: hypothetical protein ACOCSR_02640 [Wenzhouxiangella sp.]
MSESMKRLPIAVVVCLMLAACSESGEPEPDSASGDETPAQASGAETDQARRERLREAMAAYRDQRADGEDSDSARERIRQRRLARSNWWEDESLIDEIGLAASQREALDSAAAQYRGERVDTRQALARLQRELRQAVSGSDDERIEALRARRERIREELASADERWRQAVTGILDEDQLAAVREQRPRLLDPARP